MKKAAAKECDKRGETVCGHPLQIAGATVGQTATAQGKMQLVADNGAADLAEL